MAELFPCPNPRCFHWNPTGRKKCFSCQEDLTGVEGAETGGSGGARWLTVAAVVVVVAAVAWFTFGRGGGGPAAGPAATPGEGSQDSGPLAITKLSAEDGSYAALSPFKITGAASRPIQSVTVNGVPGTLEGVTSFAANVPLSEGANTLEIVVQDPTGARESRRLTVHHHAYALPEGLKFQGVNSKGMETYVSSRDAAVLVLVPSGTFQVGSDAGDADEKPVHAVKLAPFFIDARPVTNAQYARFVAETGRGKHPVPDFDKDYAAKADYPVLGATWEDAAAYAEWAGRALPTEAQWEAAARGPAGTTYPWGDEPPTGTSGHCNVKGAEDGFEHAAPVGHFPKGASAFGVEDMAGNAWQWTADWYDAAYYADSVDENPIGPEEGSQRVLRGGAFTSGPGDVRSSNRYARAPRDKPSNATFRTAVSFAAAEE